MSSANPAPAQYEFSNDQNRTLISLASSMRVVGLFQVLIGLIALLACAFAIWKFKEQDPSFREIVFLGIIALFMFFFLTTGWWIVTAASGFKYAATTTGRDIVYVMRSLDSLAKLFGLMKWILVFIMFLFLAGIGAFFYILYGPK